MGLLDDAIREHLELKRRHGANPDEVARQEREALGAPRRGEFAQPDGGAAAPAAATAEAEPAEDLLDEVPDAAAVEPPLSAPEEAPEEAPDEAAAGALPPDPVPEEPPPPEPAPGYDEDPWLPDGDEVPAEETLEHPAAAAASGEERDDVLEETPEFLQETPEHERLWFEQKPPRGFDWDK